MWFLGREEKDRLGGSIFGDLNQDPETCCLVALIDLRLIAFVFRCRSDKGMDSFSLTDLGVSFLGCVLKRIGVR